MKIEEMQGTIDEGKQLVAQLNQKAKPVGSGPVGSDLSVLLDKMWAWVKTVLEQQGAGNVKKTVLHYLHETFLPKLKDYTPMLGDIVLDVLILAVKGWCDSIPEPTP